MLNLLTPFLSVLALTLLRGWRIAVVVGVFHGTRRGGGYDGTQTIEMGYRGKCRPICILICVIIFVCK